MFAVQVGKSAHSIRTAFEREKNRNAFPNSRKTTLRGIQLPPPGELALPKGFNTAPSREKLGALTSESYVAANII